VLVLERVGPAYSSFQIEYSRNLLFKSGDKLDEVYQGLIDRTRRLLDVPRFKTIFGRKHPCHKTAAGKGRLEKILQCAHLSFIDGRQTR
jgi:hypothetical protein